MRTLKQMLEVVRLTIGYLGLCLVYAAARIWYGKRVDEIPLRRTR